jgi:REP element-mobilizing transposase RayT
MPHHVTQRGNRRQPVLFCDDDDQAYTERMADWCGRYEVRVLSYCLMPNHVHLILVPSTEDGLARELSLHESTGRPLGERSFVQRIGDLLGRDLLPGKPGPKPQKER